MLYKHILLFLSFVLKFCQLTCFQAIHVCHISDRAPDKQKNRHYNTILSNQYSPHVLVGLLYFLNLKSGWPIACFVTVHLSTVCGDGSSVLNSSSTRNKIENKSRPRGYKTFFYVNSTKLEISTTHKN